MLPTCHPHRLAARHSVVGVEGAARAEASAGTGDREGAARGRVEAGLYVNALSEGTKARAVAKSTWRRVGNRLVCALRVGGKRSLTSWA